MQLNKANYEKRKQGQIYHDYVEDFWNRGESKRQKVADELIQWSTFFFILLVAFAMGTCTGFNVEGSERYTVSRAESNLYKVEYGCSGCFFRTRDCYEMAVLDDVLYDGDSIEFENGEVCEARLLRRSYKP